MREILFRGKRGNTGEWIEGNLLVYPDGDCFICRENGYNLDYLGKYQVIPETVGQYTGLTDKNGKKIFEGDIVKVTYTSSIGETQTEKTLVTYNEMDCCFYPMRWNESCGGCGYYTEIKEIEIIGNIHDNPELLKGGVE